MEVDENKQLIPKQAYKNIIRELKSAKNFGVRPGNVFTITYGTMWNVSQYKQLMSFLN